MEYTKFGEEMRVLRARRHQTIKDMVKIDLMCLNKGSYNGRQSVSSMRIIDKTKKLCCDRKQWRNRRQTALRKIGFF